MLKSRKSKESLGLKEGTAGKYTRREQPPLLPSYAAQSPVASKARAKRSAWLPFRSRKSKSVDRSRVGPNSPPLSPGPSAQPSEGFRSRPRLGGSLANLGLIDRPVLLPPSPLPQARAQPPLHSNATSPSSPPHLRAAHQQPSTSAGHPIQQHHSYSSWEDDASTPRTPRRHLVDPLLASQSPLPPPSMAASSPSHSVFSLQQGGVPLSAFSQQSLVTSRKASLVSTEEEAGLPPGWSVDFTAAGRPYYVDHNSRRTQWQPPTLEQAQLPPPALVSRLFASQQELRPPPRGVSTQSLANPSSSPAHPGALVASVPLPALPGPSSVRPGSTALVERAEGPGLGEPPVALGEEVPEWLQVYSEASHDADHLLRWELFHLHQLSDFDAVLMRLYKQEVIHIVAAYERYRNALRNRISLLVRAEAGPARRSSLQALEMADAQGSGRPGPTTRSRAVTRAASSLTPSLAPQHQRLPSAAARQMHPTLAQAHSDQSLLSTLTPPARLAFGPSPHQPSQPSHVPSFYVASRSDTHFTQQQQPAPAQLQPQPTQPPKNSSSSSLIHMERF